MRSKFLIAAIFCAFYTSQTIAQKRENVYLLKNSGAKVDKIQDADYIRVITQNDPNSGLYDVMEYYKDNKPKLRGKSLQVEPLKYEGTVISYYPSGKRQEVTTYQKGDRSGDYYKYYPNGKVYLHSVYQQTDKPGIDHLIMDCADSTGTELAKDGNGRYLGYDGDFKRLEEEGELKAGLKSGEWKGEAKAFDNVLKFTEQYQEGKMINGKSVDADGVEYSYTQRMQQPEYKGGVGAFLHFIAESVRYPAWAKANHIGGRVLITFVVLPNGTLTDIKTKETPNEELSDEAKRVIKMAPKWTPGKYYGKAIRVSYTVPVSFAI